MYVDIKCVISETLYFVKCMHVFKSMVTDLHRLLHSYSSDEFGLLIFLKLHDLYDEQSTPLPRRCD
jgi:hypothetical protein